jgi:hypothetical protein
LQIDGHHHGSGWRRRTLGSATAFGYRHRDGSPPAGFCLCQDLSPGLISRGLNADIRVERRGGGRSFSIGTACRRHHGRICKLEISPASMDDCTVVAEGSMELDFVSLIRRPFLRARQQKRLMKQPCLSDPAIVVRAGVNRDFQKRYGSRNGNRIGATELLPHHRAIHDVIVRSPMRRTPALRWCEHRCRYSQKLVLPRRICDPK